MKEKLRSMKPRLIGLSLLTVLTVSLAAPVHATGVDPLVLLLWQIRNTGIAIQQGIQALQGAIADVQGSVKTIQSGVSALIDPSQSNVRFSPPLFVGDLGGMLCEVSNVDSAAHGIKVELIAGADGSVVSTFVSGMVPLGPGAVWVASKGSLVRDAYYCRFTVLDGSRTDIRASATVLGGGPTLAAE
jgi:hypothetical protein